MIAPALVNQARPHNGDIATLSWVLAIPSVIGLVLTMLYVSDKPPTPPSASAGAESDGFVVCKRYCDDLAFVLRD